MPALSDLRNTVTSAGRSTRQRLQSLIEPITRQWAKLQPYRQWDKEIRDAFKHSNRAARLYRGLPLLLLGYGLSVALVWSTNWMAHVVYDLAASFYGYAVSLVGSYAFGPNFYAQCMAIGFGASFVIVLRMRVVPGIRSPQTGKKIGYSVLAAAVVIWGLLTVLVTARLGITDGFRMIVAGFLWATVIALAGLTISGFGLLFACWFWFTKTLGIYWPWARIALPVLASAFGINIALFLAEHTKWLYPGNLHHAFDLIAPVGIFITYWLVTISTWVAGAIPWIVELRILLGFRRDGEAYRNSDYYQRWCNTPRDEFPTLWQSLKEGWINYRRGNESGHQEMSWRDILRESRRDIFH
ncbi:putative membrane protein [Mycobacteroides abscessus MAB_030201_1075]|uniref:Putative membrane protein n=1 Tax=Mycobacteroides abscessus MAB_030201_1075 TaxID=1335410 RepID=A0A829PMP0_9MYCO|nr:putative membrane protein [Mycobacteroides abscessus MAB_030201_1075]ETZ93805.1 putative membrane protein [Mycobacteroides abscessus MAB_030201_1061]